MHEHGSLPRARRDGLLEETLGEELLLYDQDSHIAHCLSPIAACVWRHCDGERDVSELAALAGVGENLVADALQELREKDLLDAEPVLTESTLPGVSRREALGRMTRVGAAAAGASLIISATAATPAMASSEEKVQRCVAKRGERKSCCECTSNTCISNPGITTAQECKEECERLGSRFGLWAMEGLCQ